MHVIRHKNEGQQQHLPYSHLDGHVIHSNLKIIFIPEPDSVLKVLGSNEPERNLLLHIFFSSGIDWT